MSPAGTAPAASVRVLGALSVDVGDRRVAVTAAQQRQILARLALEAPRSVSVDELIDTIWPDRAPRTARAAVHNNIRRVRTALGDAGDLIATTPDGYQLAVPVDQIDAHLLARLIEEGREARASGRAEDAANRLLAAVEAWDGVTPPELAEGPMAERLARLAERRLAALEELTDLELADPPPSDRVLELLTVEAAGAPLRESLRARLLLTLHAVGRTADALTEYNQARQTLVEELGIEPGQALRDAHAVVLAADPPPDDRAASTTGRVVPAQLPAAGPLTGRARELDRLTHGVGSRPGPTVWILSGTAGVGKTTLGLGWARLMAGRYPDGQIFAQLRGFDADTDPARPEQVVRRFLGALGVTEDEVPQEFEEAVGLYRSLVADRAILVVLDNARDAAQVRPLLPGGPDSLTVITSRHDLAGLVASDGAQLMVLDLLTDDQAAALLTDRIGRARAEAEPEAMRDIVTRCAGLPLALAVAAAQLATRTELPLAAFVEQLDAVSPLDVLDLGDASTSLRSVLSWSMRALSADAVAMLAAIGLHPPPDAATAALASVTGLPPGRARAAAAELVRANLVVERIPGRLSVHDLVRVYALELVEEDDTLLRHGLERLVEHYLHSAYVATRTHYDSPLPFTLPEPTDGVRPVRFADTRASAAWLISEQQTLVEIVQLAARTPGLEHLSWRLARAVNGWLWDRTQWQELLQSHEAALDGARRTGDREGEADALQGIGDAEMGLRRFDDAERHLHRALAIFEQIDARSRQSDVWTALTLLMDTQGRHADGIEPCVRALDLARAEGDLTGQAAALNNLAHLRTTLGSHEEALANITEALELYRGSRDRAGEAYALDTLGTIHEAMGSPRDAMVHYAAAAEKARALGLHFNLAEVLGNLGAAHLAVGDVAAAHAAYRSALDILEGLGHPMAEEFRERIAAMPPVSAAS